MRPIDADELRTVLAVFTETDPLGHTPLRICDAMPTIDPGRNEWCTDCKEYDKEKHCCPRFNRMIAEAVKEVRENAKEERRGKWNVIKKRPMDEEERREWSERLGYDIEYEDAFPAERSEG